MGLCVVAAGRRRDAAHGGSGGGVAFCELAARPDGAQRSVDRAPIPVWQARASVERSSGRGPEARWLARPCALTCSSCFSSSSRWGSVGCGFFGSAPVREPRRRRMAGIGWCRDLGGAARCFAVLSSVLRQIGVCSGRSSGRRRQCSMHLASRSAGSICSKQAQAPAVQHGLAAWLLQLR